jgi:hypothetical protein
MQFLLPAALAVALLNMSAKAQTYSAGGIGNSSCGTWTAARLRPNGSEAYSNGQWILGFLSGVGWTREYDPLNRVDAPGVFAWIDNYCRAHPLDPIADAGAAFVHAHPR